MHPSDPEEFQMVSVKEPKMGRFSVELELANNKDLIRVEDGRLKPAQVRRGRIRGVVDSGATRLVIPKALARQLGLEISGKTMVRYADGRTAQREIADQIRLTYAGRGGVFSAIVEPRREAALIGAIVMEDLDLLVDCVGQRLVPRDPKQIISEVE
jgi:predicted aspartyl protease